MNLVSYLCTNHVNFLKEITYKLQTHKWNIFKSRSIYSCLEPLYSEVANSLLLLGKNVRGFLLGNHSFAKGADSSEWLRVNVVWSEGSTKYREIPIYAKCLCDQKYYWYFLPLHVAT